MRGSDDENQGHEAEAATVRDNLEVRFVDGLETVTDSRTHVVAGDDFALLTGLLEGLCHLEFKLGIVGGAHAHLVGVGGSTAERADLGTRDAGSGEGLAQVLFVPAVVLVLNRIDLATGKR